MKEHTVRQGECLATIAKKYDFRLWQTIYDAPENAKFREKRPNPNVIYSGDKIIIPDKRQKTETGVTEKKHRFKLKTKGWQLRLEIRDETFESLEDIPYELYVDKAIVKRDRTGKNGLIETDVDCNARSGTLKIMGDEIDLRFGHLDPVTRVKGIQQRLNNMGFKAGPVDGIVGRKTRAAVMAFQTTQENLDPTGEIDDDTRRTLLKAHDNDEELRDIEEDMTESDYEPPQRSSEIPPPPGGFEFEEDTDALDDLTMPDNWDSAGLPTPLDLSDKPLLIRGAQERLKVLGFDPGQIDGIDGPKTQRAVCAFQQFCRENAEGDDPSIIDSGPVDGIVGPKTKRAIESYFGC